MLDLALRKLRETGRRPAKPVEAAARSTHAAALLSPSRLPQNFSSGRVSVCGKFFQLQDRKWFLKGLTYGPFAPNAQGTYLPEPAQIKRDLAQIQEMGANCLRVYRVPPRSLLDEALAHGLRVLVDVPWEKHRCFFEDWSAQEDARAAVERAARALGDHPGLLGISVANEFPADVVRFHGHRRVERFIDELCDIVKQTSPDCLATFANYPTTEYLTPHRRDFSCFNVYLDDETALAAYLDRLQHLAGPLPIVLGEYGTCSLRQGEEAQAKGLAQHVAAAFRHGLAGSTVFSFTDDWFTGGYHIDNWGFGVTRRDRSEKPAAGALRRAWQSVPYVDDVTTEPLPRVSVVVCSYNGGSTLRECLTSLQKLNYPDYEVILVDDGSTDDTPSIVRDFPNIHTIRQPNMGLSVARNVGAQAATGEIVAYTDSDCVADPDWLYYLVRAMLRLNVEAIGGPNLPPPSDSWTAHCVAASPGGPSHVMLNDQFAEHVPGCNMAFRRDVLLKLGGFDSQFRQAGDDVDVCWRLLDCNYRIGFAAAAMVWHHRRSTVSAYLKQQKGYGRSEALLHFKHPQRFNRFGCSLWSGVIYGEGAVGLPLVQPVIYHGKHGSGLFQTIHVRQEYTLWAYTTLLEWHALAGFMLALSVYLPSLLVICGLMWTASLMAVTRAAMSAPLRPQAPRWCRPLILSLHLLQPVTRAWHRYWERQRQKSISDQKLRSAVGASPFRGIRLGADSTYWMSETGIGRNELLEALESCSRELGIRGILDHAWDTWDMTLFPSRWHTVTIRTATEELGQSRRFTRARCSERTTASAKVIVFASVVWSLCSLVGGHPMGQMISAALLTAVLIRLVWSRRKSIALVNALIQVAADRAGLRRTASGSPPPESIAPVAPTQQAAPMLAGAGDGADEIEVDVA